MKTRVLPLLFLCVASSACGGRSSPEVTTVTPTVAETLAIREHTPTLPAQDTPAPTQTPTRLLLHTAAPQPSTETPTNTPTVVPPSATPTSPPTSTATPLPLLPSAKRSEELREKWGPPLFAMSLTLAAYQGLLQTADKLQANEIDGFTALGELLASGLLVAGIDEGISEWKATSDQTEYEAAIRGRVAEAKSVITRWTDKEISSPDVRGLLEEGYESGEAILQEMLQAMQDDGLAPEDIRGMLDSLEEQLGKIGEEMGELAPGPASPTPAPSPEPGQSRRVPFARGELASAPNRDVRVLETLLGDDAWRAVEAANQFNDPAPEGWQYLLVKLWVRCTATDGEEHWFSGADFKVTGSQLMSYSPAPVVEPDPPLDAQLFAGGEAEGWVAFLVRETEDNLILVADELMSFQEDRYRFIALDQGASISVASELGSTEPTDLGLERTAPVPIGQTATSEDWQVTVLEVVRGDLAWQMVQEANQFNDPPSEGMEYIVVSLRVRYIGTEDPAELIDGSSFRATGSANVLHDRPSVVEPEPALDASLYPGGEHVGWVVVQAAQDETDPVLVFEPLFDLFGENRRYLALEE